MHRDSEYPMLLKPQADALRQFAEQDNVPAAHVETLARITGRGYRPPTDAAGWRKVYEPLRKAGVFEGER